MRIATESQPKRPRLCRSLIQHPSGSHLALDPKLAQAGLVLCDYNEAEKNPDFIAQYSGKIVPPTDGKFCATLGWQNMGSVRGCRVFARGTALRAPGRGNVRRRRIFAQFNPPRSRRFGRAGFGLQVIIGNGLRKEPVAPGRA